MERFRRQTYSFSVQKHSGSGGANSGGANGSGGANSGGTNSEASRGASRGASSGASIGGSSGRGSGGGGSSSMYLGLLQVIEYPKELNVKVGCNRSGKWQSISAVAHWAVSGDVQIALHLYKHTISSGKRALLYTRHVCALLYACDVCVL
jgi:hypothetical protein